MASAHSDELLHIYVLVGEEQSGPFTIEQIRGLWNQAAITSDAYCWYEGLENWEPLAVLMTERVVAGQTRDSSERATTQEGISELRAKAHDMLSNFDADPDMLANAAKSLADAAHDFPSTDETKKDILYQLGLVYERLGNEQESLDCMTQIYEVDYGYRDVAVRVEALYARGIKPPPSKARQGAQRASHLPYCSSCRCHVNPNVVSRSKTGPGAAIAVGDNYLLAQRSTSELIKVCPKCGERVYNEADRAELVKKVDSDLAAGRALLWIFGIICVGVVLLALLLSYAPRRNVIPPGWQ